mmetsp:Transcript_26686/g.76902  ORF Transcript_26686/g.76902 Transcript_26686/m.76902 type:complete len:938 (-) Transcript_26686:50-2863(-)
MPRRSSTASRASRGSEQSSDRGSLIGPGHPRIRRARWGSTFFPSESRSYSATDLLSRSPCRARLAHAAAATVESKFFVIFGILLTVWALCGDDLRLLLTHKTADTIFDAGVVFCIVFFSVEVVISSIGKDDYFMGFFFGLDVISTATLFLDLTVVAEALFNAGGGGESETDKARSSKTARAGARVGRVVRVLRLVRIVKLFKAAQSSKKNRTKSEKTIQAGEEVVWEDEQDVAETELRESLVGKKLSARTTQRTIVLVLIMLIVIPLLSTEGLSLTPASAEYGAEEVLQAFRAMLRGGGTRDSYEGTLLKYMYYHNWFLGSVGCPREDAGCSFLSYSQVFWVGVAGEDSSLETYAESARIRPEKVQQWNAMAEAQDDLFNFGTMPPEVVDILGSEWDRDCSNRGARSIGLSLLAKEIPDRVGVAIQCPAELRSTEYETFSARLITEDSFRELHFKFYFDLRPYTREEASFNIIKTAFICVVLCMASLLFTRDANQLVLQPVEQMITKVEAIRDDPLVAMKMADDEFKREEMLRIKASKLDGSLIRCCRNLFAKDRNNLMETVILEKTIIKLGSLLALGFGEAGTNIVSSNMSGASTSGVNATIEGSRVDCIIGCAGIRNFSTATEVLQGKVMTFVNQVAEIVHGIVDKFSGAVNKNAGDMFLVIWRTTGAPAEEVRKMAEMSVIAFARILVAVHVSPVLAAYRRHPGLQQRLRQDCKVDLSFGLHRGWAIEGAVGSEFKIDASYLSPNVNIAMSLEQAASRIYGVSVLVSDVVVGLCGLELASNLRLIDKVTIRGSRQPLELFVLDLDSSALDVAAPMPPFVWNSKQRYLARQFLEAEKKRFWTTDRPLHGMFEAMTDVMAMRRPYTVEFFQKFIMGYRNYVEGEWAVAHTFLDKSNELLGRKDGPSNALLRFMEAQGFKPPDSWQGVHELSTEIDD